MEYRIQYRNEQGVLLRIITAITRRGIPITVMAAALGHDGLYVAIFDLDATVKQEQQLRRDWNAIIGVEDVRALSANIQALPN